MGEVPIERCDCCGVSVDQERLLFRGGRWKERDNEMLWATVVVWGGNDVDG